MARYLVTAAGGIAVAAGAVLSHLSPDQIDRRRHVLRPLSGGRFEAEAPTMFKWGEVFGLEGTLDKAMLAGLEPVTHVVPGGKGDPKLPGGGD